MLVPVEGRAGSLEPTPVNFAETPSQSAWDSLHGQKALTPIIAGSICGGCVFIGWFIGAVLYYRHHRRRKIRARKVALGLKAPKEEPPKVEQKIIIPPDPAILSGKAQPGDCAFPGDEHKMNHPAFGHFRRPRKLARTEEGEKEDETVDEKHDSSAHGSSTANVTDSTAPPLRDMISMEMVVPHQDDIGKA